MNSFCRVRTIWWEDAKVMMPDQTLLPGELKIIGCETVEQVWEAIRKLRVRGAPALGVAAAYGVIVGLKDYQKSSVEVFDARLQEVCGYLATSRPTAVNLFWALERMKSTRRELTSTDPKKIWERLFEEAEKIRTEDEITCSAIGRHGQQLVPDPGTIITHCNAGALATAGIGTALAVIYAAHEAGKKVQVYADETRPLLQGSRLTAWELMENDIPVTVICDNMAAVVMRKKKVDCCVVGADRIASNGDAANKIGTYGLSILAKYHNVPFYVAAPLSTIDMSLPSGEEIPIEERDSEEICCGFGKRTAPKEANVYNPAFDVTPAENIAAIITEKGVLRAPYSESIKKAFEQ